MIFLQNKIKLKEIKNILPVLVNIYLIVFGFGWMIIHIFFRFFIERPSYNLQDIKNIISFQHYLFFCIFILFHILLIVFSCFTIYMRRITIKERSIITQIKLFFTTLLYKIYWKPLEFIHDKIAPHIPGSAKFFLYLETLWQTKGFTYFLILLFEILPKILIPCIFFIEIIFFNQIKFFVYSLSFYILPVIFQVFLKFFSSFATRNLPFFLEAYSHIKGIDPIMDKNGSHLGYTSYEVIVKEEYLNTIDSIADDIKKRFHVDLGA